MTGLRQGELLGLRWVDVDWSASRVRVAESFTRGAFDSPKSHRGRSLPMPDRLAQEVEHHFQRSRWRSDQDLVFARRFHAQLSRDAEQAPSAALGGCVRGGWLWESMATALSPSLAPRRRRAASCKRPLVVVERV